jgi:hypothetical protein
MVLRASRNGEVNLIFEGQMFESVPPKDEENGERKPRLKMIFKDLDRFYRDVKLSACRFLLTSTDSKETSGSRRVDSSSLPWRRMRPRRQ